MQSVLNEPKSAGGDAWLQIAPLLDDALGRLGERDRHAIVLRFFENKSLEEVGAALGASEDAAKMRVNRALEKLRKIFSKRGVVLTATLIAGAVSANSVQAAPVGLAMTISAMAVKGSVVAASITTLVQGTMKIMTWMKLKLAACVGIGLIVVVGASTIILAQIKNQNTSPVGSAAANETIVIVPMESVGKVRRGMTTNEVEAVLGKPERMQGKMMIYDKKFGMSVGQTKLGVMVVFCGDSSGGGPGVKTFKGRTKEGIGTGSSREEVVKALGQPTSATPWEARLQQEQLQYKPLGLEFMLEKGKVFNILVDFRKPQ